MLRKGWSCETPGCPFPGTHEDLAVGVSVAHAEGMAISDEVWFITGSSSGLGRALAEHVLEGGGRVAATARDPQAVADLAQTYGRRVLTLALDVTDLGEIDRAVSTAEEVFGRIDVLVNNAGYGYLAAIEEGEDREVRALFDANVFGLIDVTKAVLPDMRARRAGHIVNISSFGGLAAFGATGYYHATKFAVEGLSESLAAEVTALGIAVTIVEPGGMRTNWSGSSMRKSALQLEDYAETAGARREATLATFGRQPGDPAKAAEAIVAAVAAEAPPLRLLLGSDALGGARAKVKRLTDGIEQWASVSASTDFAA
jgi:NADP-dependent 3-hydroxy acid dehydrogenase YdfG